MEAFTGKFISAGEYADAEWVIIGAPFDGTSSFRPGARFAPAAIRQASIGLETFSPYLGKDLDNVHFADFGDIELPLGNAEFALAQIEQALSSIIGDNKKLLLLGGEHLISLPLAK